MPVNDNDDLCGHASLFLCVPFPYKLKNCHEISLTPSHYTERHVTQIPGRIINKEDKLQIARREKIWQVPFCIKRI